MNESGLIDFLLKPSLLLQLLGGTVALVAAISAIFYKDTVDKESRKLTKWGWTSLFFLFLGAGISSSSKYYEMSQQRIKDHREMLERDSINRYQDSIRYLQIVKLDSIAKVLLEFQDKSLKNQKETQTAVSSSLNKIATVSSDLRATTNSINPIYPFTISYCLAVDLSAPELNALLAQFRSLKSDIEQLSDTEIKNVIRGYHNESLNTILMLDDMGVADSKIEFYKSDKDRVIYLCKRKFSSLSIRYDGRRDNYVIVDSSEYSSSSKPMGNRNIENLIQLEGEKYDLNIWKYFVPEIPQKLLPLPYSNIQIQFAKQPPFIIEKEWRMGRAKYYYDTEWKEYKEVVGQTTFKISFKKWDKIYPKFH